MRTALALLFAAGVAGVAAFFLLGGGERPPDPQIRDNSREQELADHPYLLEKTGTLVIRARAADGSVPFGTEVGYDTPREDPTYLYAGEDGRREIADAPWAPMVVLARAPGYRLAQTRRTLLAGVPVEVLLTLEPEGD